MKPPVASHQSSFKLWHNSIHPRLIPPKEFLDSQWSSQPAQLAQLPTFSPEFSVRLPTLVPSFYQTELPLHQITLRLHLKSPKPLLPDLQCVLNTTSNKGHRTQ